MILAVYQQFYLRVALMKNRKFPKTWLFCQSLTVILLFATLDGNTEPQLGDLRTCLLV